MIILEMNGDGTAMVMVGTSEKMENNTMIIHMMESNIYITLIRSTGSYGLMKYNNGLMMIFRITKLKLYLR